MKAPFSLVFHIITILLMFLAEYARGESPVMIKGRIIDEHKQPIPFVSVYITLPQHPTSILKGSITNDHGEFSLPAIENKSYILKTMMLGYQEISRHIQTDSAILNIGDVVLKEVSYQMSEVVVKPPLQVTADKIIYHFENDPARARSNLHDMLSKMPLIIVGPNGKISVGSEDKTYKVLRKGREDALVNFEHVPFEEMLKKLPAMGFTTFEIWTVVPPKYEKYDYVINILPDPTQKLFGAVGSPEAYYHFDKKELQAGIGGNGSANLFRVAGGMKYEYMDAPKKTRETTTAFYAKENQPTTSFWQKETSHDIRHAWKVDLSTSLDISKRQFITLKWNASFMDSKNHRQIISEKTAENETQSQGTSHYRSTYKANSWNIGATYQLEFPKPNRLLNISYLTQTSPVQRHDDREIYTPSDEEIKVNTFATEDIKSHTHRMQLNYYDEFLKNRLKFTAQTGYLLMDYQNEGKTTDKATQLENVNCYSLFDQDFHRIDGFIHFSYNINKRLNFSTKTDIDYLPSYNKTKAVTGTFQEYIQQKKLLFNWEGKLFYQFAIQEPGKKDEKPFDEMTPDEKIAYIAKNAGAGRSINDIINQSSSILPNSSLRFDYTYKQRRPGNSQLTNYSDEQDPLYTKQGNPNLHSEAYHTFSLRFSSWFINSLSALYSFSNNKIVSQSRRDENKILQSFYNSGKTRDYLVGISHLFFKSNMTVGSYLNGSYIDFGDGNWRKQQQLNLSARYSLKVFANCEIAPELHYHKTFNQGATGEKETYPLDLSAIVTWIPKIGGKEVFIIAGTNDVLQWNKRTRRFADMLDYKLSEETRYRGLPLYLSIRFTLGKFKVKPVKTAKSGAKINGFSTDKD